MAGEGEAAEALKCQAQSLPSESTGEPMDTRAEVGYAASWTTEGISGEKTMTEAEWLACADPRPMLDFLRKERKVAWLANG